VWESYWLGMIPDKELSGGEKETFIARLKNPIGKRIEEKRELRKNTPFCKGVSTGYQRRKGPSSHKKES